jgi:hypothetical protein
MGRLASVVILVPLALDVAPVDTVPASPKGMEMPAKAP